MKAAREIRVGVSPLVAPLSGTKKCRRFFGGFSARLPSNPAKEGPADGPAKDGDAAVRVAWG